MGRNGDLDVVRVVGGARLGRSLVEDALAVAMRAMD